MFEDSEDEEIMAKIEASGKKQASVAAAVRCALVAVFSSRSRCFLVEILREHAALLNNFNQ